MHCPTLVELPLPPTGKTGWPWTEESPRLPDTGPDSLAWPRSSIVMPSFNQGQFLEETLRSVLLQVYPDVEYIVIDGGSRDDSVEIIRRYEPWLAYWVSEPDRGQPHAINKGLERTTGEIIAYINSDDYYLPGAFSTVAQEYVREPFDLIAGICRYVDAYGNKLLEAKGGPHNLLDILDLARYERSYLTQPEVFWTRHVLNTCGLLREDLLRCFDYEYWLRAIASGFSIRYVDEVIACFRRHVQQKTRDPAGGLAETMPLVHKYIETHANLRSQERRRISRGLHWGQAKVHYLRSRQAADEGRTKTAIVACLRGVGANFPFSLRERLLLSCFKRIMLSLIIGRNIRQRVWVL